MFYMNQNQKVANNNKNQTFIKKGDRPMKKKVSVETRKLTTSTEFSVEEKQHIIDAQTGMTVNTHERVIVAKTIEHQQKDFRVDRKLAAEAEAEAHFKKMKDPKSKAKDGITVFDRQDNCEVVEKLPGAKFKVKIGPQFVLCYLGGKLKQNKINIGVGDIVKVEVSAYDVSNGRITWRF